MLAKDPAHKLYVANIAARHGHASIYTARYSLEGVRKFLQFLGRDVNETALSQLIADTREQHKRDDFSTDDALLRFVQLRPPIHHAHMGAYIKGIFKANRCRLEASFNTTFTHSTRKIETGVLKAIYDSLPRNELRLIIDFQTYAGERVAAICKNTALSQWEDCGNYTLIHIKKEDTKARNAHICIIPKGLADIIREYANYLGRTVPFPNYETLWRNISKHAQSKFGVRLTSHYLRKRFHTIAGKTPMPVNSWDYLMGDKQTYGHNAGTYTLEDFSDLIEEYDRYLAPFLSIRNPMEPDEPREPSSNPKIDAIVKENQELKEQIIKLTKLLTEALAKTD